jgi:saccharopepsin
MNSLIVFIVVSSIATISDAIVQELPLSSVADGIYITNITIGTPPQTFGVQIDTSGYILYVPDSTCDSVPFCTTAYYAYLNKFNSSASSSYASDFTTVGCQPGANTGNASCFPDPSYPANQFNEFLVYGFFGLDYKVCIGTQCATQVFGQANNIVNSTYDNREDGVLGLTNVNYATVQPYNPLIYQLINCWDDPMFTIVYNHLGILNQDIVLSNGGWLTLGAQDTDHCTGCISWAPVLSDNYWAVSVTGWSVGTVSNTDQPAQYGQMNSGTHTIHVPQDFYDAFNSQLGFSDTVTEIPCVGNYPEITIYINNIPFSINYVTYLGKGTNGGCVSRVVLSSSNTFDKGVFAYEFGAPWFQTFCTTFDVGDQRVGFANNNFVPTEP